MAIQFLKIKQENVSMTTEGELKIELGFIVALIVCAIGAVLVACSGWLKPGSDSPGVWFQRSGSIAAIFSAFAQFRINNFLERIRGGTFAESWGLHNKFIGRQEMVSWTVTVIGVLGAVVWGYGDIIYMIIR
jgi:hypothetical protein